MLQSLDIAYTRFNSQRTLKSALPSAFRVEELGELSALVDPSRRLPGYPNRVLGLRPDTLPALAEVLAVYERESLNPEIQCANHPAVAARLGELGYHCVRTLAYLSREPNAAPAPPMTVERWQEARVDDYFDLLRRIGVEATEEIRALRRQYYCTPTFRVHVACIDRVPSAWATLFVHENQGFFGNAYTFESARGRGCQSALIAARLQDAHRLGLQSVVTDLEFESQSHRNIERAGFHLERVEAVWQR